MGNNLTRHKISDRASYNGFSHAAKARHENRSRFAASPSYIDYSDFAVAGRSRPPSRYSDGGPAVQANSSTNLPNSLLNQCARDRHHAWIPGYAIISRIGASKPRHTRG